MKFLKKSAVLFICLIFLYCTKTDTKAPVQKTEQVNAPVHKIEKVKADSTVKAPQKETNAAQSYMDAQKANIQKAKDALEKNQKAQEDQEEILKDIH